MHFNKVDVDNDAAYFHDMPDDMISLNRLKQSKLSISLEITDLIFDLSDNLNISGVKLHLSVNVKLIRNLSECIGDKDDLILSKVIFEVDAAGVSHEECDLAFVINALNVNLGVNLPVPCICRNLIVL